MASLLASAINMMAYINKISYYITTKVLRDSDVMFCLQCYQGLIIDRSLVYTSGLLIRVISSRVYKLMFYLASINKILRHCHSLVATTVVGCTL